MMNNPDYLFTTSRLGFRPWHPADLLPFAAMNQDPEVMRYFPKLVDPEQTRDSVQRQIDQQRDHGFCFWATDLLATAAFIGFIGINQPRFKASFTPCFEIGWRLMPEYWGKGLATEGAKACVSYARHTLEIPELYSFTPLSNKPSERVMQKIGMHKLGTFRHPLIPLAHDLSEHVLYRITLQGS